MSEKFTKEEIDEALADLELLELIKIHDDKIEVDAPATMSYLDACFESLVMYFKKIGKFDELKDLYHKDPDVALYTAISSCLLADIAMVREKKLKMPTEEAVMFERRYAEVITMTYLHLLKQTPLYDIAMLLLNTAIGG